MNRDKIALITGINGFVGPYLKTELENSGYDVFGLDLHDGPQGKSPMDGLKVFQCDLTDFESTYDVIQKTHPDLIFHLAGFSSVAKSFEYPDVCFNVNVNGTKNLLEALVRAHLNTKVLIVSSAEIYGKPEYIPTDEKHKLAPVSPYAKSRVAQENLCKEYSDKYGVSILIARSFNHTGPGQPEPFVIPSFRRQIADAEDGGVILVGNLEVVRDFSDVRDTVKAYRMLLEKGEPGEVYNVGSGHEYLLSDILDALIKDSGKKLSVRIDPARYRKVDVEKMICDNRKLRKIIDFEFRKII